MIEYDQYFEYLVHRSRLGEVYRKHWLYPRISSHLIGETLDVGCGIGDMLSFRSRTVGVDVNLKTVDYCRQRGLDARVMQPDILPFADGAFDSVLLDNVLEHIVDPGPLLEEVYRVLRQGGRLLVGVPGVRGWNSDSDHKVYYDELNLRSRIEQSGFESSKFFHAPLWKSAWLSHKMRQYCIYGVFRRVG